MFFVIVYKMEEVVNHLLLRGQPTQKDCVMFDIDDTLINQKTGKVIPHIKKLLDSCRQLGYKIIIITARPDTYEVRQMTYFELRELGIFYSALYFRTPSQKSYLKRELKRKRGWNFVLSVGDQPTDLTDSEVYLQVV